MSRTDVHRPYPVQLADSSEHRRSRNGWGGDEDESLLFNTCGCPLCSGTHYRREERRRSRHRAQREAGAQRRVDWRWELGL